MLPSVSKLLFFVMLFNSVCAADAPLASTDLTKPNALKDVDTNLGAKLDTFGFHNIKYDTALLYIVNNVPNKVAVWAQSSECYKCKLQHLNTLEDNSTMLFHMDTWWELTIALSPTGEVDFNESISFCRPKTFHFGENGNYSLFINRNKTTHAKTDECILTMNHQPDITNTPIYVALGVYALVALLYTILNYGYKSGAFTVMMNWCTTNRIVNNDLGPAPIRDPNVVRLNTSNETEQKRPKRLKSLDAFRGISIVIMIFVNHGGGGYWFFKHSRWNGLTVADLVFPWFVFIMGTSMTLSFRGLVRHNVSRWGIVKKIIRRTIILFGLGIMLDGGVDLATFRVPGVLQRFAISYLVVASLHLKSAKPAKEEYSIPNKYYRAFQDLVDYWFEWVFILALMVLYVCLVFLMPVPGCPTGYIGPGGPLLSPIGDLSNCTGGATGYIDRFILGDNHLYSHATLTKVYHTTLNYDPEGILGSIPSIFITFLGLQAGKILLLHPLHSSRLKRLLIWCLITGALAILLCGASKEEGWIPINKNLWSLSYVLAMASTSFLLLTFCYITVDMRCWWSGVPFFFAGMNPITIYCGSEILLKHFPFSWTPLYGTHTELLFMSLLSTTLWVIIAYYMYFINFFVKI